MNFYQKQNFLNTIPPVTRNIIIINAIVWLACLAFIRLNIDLAEILGIHYFQSRGFHIYQLVTYMFTHVSLTHIFFNMFAVFMFGTILEQTWGVKRYLTYYLVTGIGAGLIQMLVYYFRIQALLSNLPADALTAVHNQGYDLLLQNLNFTGKLGDLNLLYNVTTIGASGAVFGILLAFGMLHPNIPLYIMFIPIPVKAKYFVSIYGLVELFLGIANRTGDNVAHFAHLGGMLFGIIMILFWRRKDNNKTFNLFKKWPIKKKMKISYLKNEKTTWHDRKADYDYNAQKNRQNEEIDRILEKIKKSGYNCLSESEKKKLFDASK